RLPALSIAGLFSAGPLRECRASAQTPADATSGYRYFARVIGSEFRSFGPTRRSPRPMAGGLPHQSELFARTSPQGAALQKSDRFRARCGGSSQSRPRTVEGWLAVEAKFNAHHPSFNQMLNDFRDWHEADLTQCPLFVRL